MKSNERPAELLYANLCKKTSIAVGGIVALCILRHLAQFFEDWLAYAGLSQGNTRNILYCCLVYCLSPHVFVCSLFTYHFVLALFFPTNRPLFFITLGILRWIWIKVNLGWVWINVDSLISKADPHGTGANTLPLCYPVFNYLIL